MSILRRILVVIFCTAVGHGIVFALGLDQLVANEIRVMMTPEWREAISWILAGAFGLAGLAGWEIWRKTETVPRLTRKQKRMLLDQAAKMCTLMRGILIASTDGNPATERLARNLGEVFNRVGIAPWFVDASG